MARRFPRLDIRQAGPRIAIVLGAVALVNVAFNLALVQPAVREYRDLSEGDDPFQRLNERREQVETHESYLEAVQRAEDDLKRLREELLSTRDLRLVDVQLELAEICAQFNIDLASVATANELLLDEELDRISMNVPLEGNYQNLRKFLLATEQSDEFLVIERVSLARGKEGGKLLALNVMLATYFTAPEEMVERNRSRRGNRG
jgi:hypothetical protein